LLRGFFVFPFSLIPPGTNLLLTFQRAIPQNSDFPPSPRSIACALPSQQAQVFILHNTKHGVCRSNISSTLSLSV